MKLSGTHSSLIDLATKLVKYLDKKVVDLKVSPGIIISKRSATARNQKVKITQSISGLDLTVTQNATIQKLRIFNSSPEPIVAHIKKFCQDNDIQFSK